MRRGRAATWIAVWAVSAAMALLVAWLGVRAVIHSTTGPVVPLAGGAPGVTAPPRAVAPGPHGKVPRASPPAAGRASATPPARGTPATSLAPPAGPAPAPSPVEADDEHVYRMTGGNVILQITDSKCTLVTATADSGYTVENWSSMGWLRVDFNRGGAEASSLVCDWYQQSPAVTIGA